MKDDNGMVLGNKSGLGIEDDWLLSIGNAKNENDKPVKLDSSNPHVIFVCGARGSGKSYTLGVLAEEISKNNSDIAAVIIDPIGIFWSMKYPNKEEDELELLKKRGLEPEGMDNVNVLIPEGHSEEVPNETYEDIFSFQPSSLTADDWCLTFGIDRYSPQGLLLERAIEKVKSGYTRKLGDKGDRGSRDVEGRENFSIDDLLECLNHDKELLSKKKGFKASTRRALTSRMTTAKEWGIFGREKSLSDIIQKGTISVFDVSFLPENIGSLVLGILSRKILSARKKAARKEAVHDLKGEGKEEANSIPPTWLMVDEAHSFAPSSGKTAATNPLVEYVKQGRRPGLSAILSTQQPSALDSKIISQLDILISHQLSFEKDIKEVWKRMPTSLPENLKKPDSLKKLPEGTAILADKEINQAFFVSIRPRLSQHEGRERVLEEDDTEEEEDEDKESENEEGNLTEENGAVKTLDVDSLEESEDEEEDEELEFIEDSEDDTVELLSVPFQTDLLEASEKAESERKRFLKFLWRTENLRRVSRHYYPVWSFLIDYYPTNGEHVNLRVQVDGLSGEIIKRGADGLERTRGARSFSKLSDHEKNVLFRILERKKSYYENLKNYFESETELESSVSHLSEENLIDCKEEMLEEKEKLLITPKEDIDIPKKLSNQSLLAAEAIPEPSPQEIRENSKIEKIIDREQALNIIRSFGDMEVLEEKTFYYPYWIANLVRNDGSRIVAIDGVFGSRDQYAEKMMRRRVS